jgi:hypothetical protein
MRTAVTRADKRSGIGSRRSREFAGSGEMHSKIKTLEVSMPPERRLDPEDCGIGRRKDNA